MSTLIPLVMTKPSKELVYDLINAANVTSLKGIELSEDNVTLGAPTVAVGSGRTTNVVVTPIAGKGISGDPVTVTYERVFLADILDPATGEPLSGAYSIVDTGEIVDAASLLAVVNRTFGTGITEDETMPDPNISITYYPRNAGVYMLPTSYVYLSALMLRITAPTTDFPSAFKVTNLGKLLKPTVAIG